MDLRDILKVLHRNWIAILACALIGVLVAGGASLLVKPTYTAHTRLFVAIQSTGTVTELQQGNSFSQARVQSYVQTALTPVVLQPVIDELGLTVTPSALAKQVSAQADLNTVLITLSASSDSPVEAAAIAQAMTSSLIDVVDQLESSEKTPATSPVKLSVVTPATAPEAPSAPSTPMYLLAGLAVGVLVGVGLSLLRRALDQKVRGIEDVQKIVDTPLLGGIAYDADAAKKPLLTQTVGQSPRAESFRQIRTNLQFAMVNSKSNSLLVTSSLPGEGKSTTAINTALALAQAGKRVVLVDADLRRPMVANYLGLEANAGLTTALLGSAEVEDLLQPWGDDDLYVLTSGQVPPNPSELLGSAAMTELVQKLEATFDSVIIDAPPLIPVTDATVLAQVVGGVALVVGAAKVTTKDVEKSLDAMKLVNSSLLGVVLNLLPTKGPDAYSYSYYSYDSKPELPLSTPSNRTGFNGSHMAGSRRANKTRSKASNVAGLHR